MHRQFHDRRHLIPFRSMLLPHILTDTLVIGAGVAGLSAAMRAAAHGDVIVLAKDALDVSATAWAQGGIAAAVGGDDDADAHARDTVDAGDGLCRAAAVDILVREGPEAIEVLCADGMPFDRDADGSLALGREGGHRRRRVLHAAGAETGRVLAETLRANVAATPGVRVFANCFALDLLTGDDGDTPRVLGAITWHARYGLQIIWARATILAAGGAGQVYRETTNPRVATGDGLAMAWRAGAEIADAEFMQFHPTTLYVAGAARALITEAVRGEGAHLVDRQGQRFMVDAHPMAELAPRDVVSRAIVARLARSQEPAVYLDVRHLDAQRFAERFPSIVQLLRSFDIDPATDLIPVHPSAHYTIGGVWTDLDGRSSLPGLFACGEASCTGLHGANRLASNSLLEGLVFGRRAGAATEALREHGAAPRTINSEVPVPDHGELDLHDVRSSLRSAMWRNVGIERAGHRLADVEDMFDFWARYTLDAIFDGPAGWETQNLLTVGAIMTRAARWREETRGVHVRTDHPETREEFRVHAVWRRGAPAPRLEPVEPAVEAAS